MHPLHDHIARLLGDRLRARKVVVLYDPGSDLRPFIDELRGGPRVSVDPVEMPVGGVSAQLVEGAGSLLEVRLAVEPLTCGDTPASLVIYLPDREWDRHGSLLMELEKAGTAWRPELRQLAREALLQRYTLGVVDEMLPPERRVSYGDLARTLATPGEAPPSILRAIFHDSSGHDTMLAAWLARDGRDAEIVEKSAQRELSQLVKSRLGLDLPPDGALAKWRAVAQRYVLAGEFRADLSCAPPDSLAGVATPSSSDATDAIRAVARSFRASAPADYERIADQIEADLGLATAKIPARCLGTIDTFRFEERALLSYAGELITEGRFDEALTYVTQREQSFWLDRDIARTSQWEAVRRMAELGRVASLIRSDLTRCAGGAAEFFEAYTRVGDGWYRLDFAQRRLEAWLPGLDDDPEERPLAYVRRAYDDVVHTMTTGFTRALEGAAWMVPGALHQTRVWSEVLQSQPKPVAYLLVDAMRYEMGVELSQRLPKRAEVAVRAAVCALPSITPVGMAALMPGASASFSVVEQSGRLGARIDDAFLSDVAGRKRFAASRVPKLVDLTLDDLLGLSPAKLSDKLKGAPVVIVRSQEIDQFGETGSMLHARQVMDAVIDNLVRAVRKLASAGVEHSVITADHGHLFFATERDESMRTDPPGGQTLELHRRCWAGRGGSTPAGCVRVSSASLGYAGDLDLVFPRSHGVMRSNGGLAFYHGGPSLQELVIPVVTVRTAREKAGRAEQNVVQVAGVPTAITNRIITFEVASLLGATVCPALLASGRKVGTLIGALGNADVDRVAGTVVVPPGVKVTLALQLLDDTVERVALVLQDPATDAELYRAPHEIPVKLGV